MSLGWLSMIDEIDALKILSSKIEALRLHVSTKVKPIYALFKFYETSLHPFYEYISNISEREFLEDLVYEMKSIGPFTFLEISIEEDMIILERFQGNKKVEKMIYGGAFTPVLKKIKRYIQEYVDLCLKGEIRKIRNEEINIYTYICPYCFGEGVIPVSLSDKEIKYMCKSCEHEIILKRSVIY